MPTSTTSRDLLDSIGRDARKRHDPAADQALINRYFADIGGSSFYGVCRYSTPSTTIQNRSTFGGWVADNTPAASARSGDGTGDHLSPRHHRRRPPGRDPACDRQPPGESAVAGVQTNDIYFVFLPRGCVPDRAHARSLLRRASSRTAAATTGLSGAFNGNKILYAAMPYGGTLVQGQRVCGGQVLTSPNFAADGNSINADYEASIVSHEHFETVPDPLGNAWLSPRIEMTTARTSTARATSSTPRTRATPRCTATGTSSSVNGATPTTPRRPTGPGASSAIRTILRWPAPASPPRGTAFTVTVTAQTANNGTVATYGGRCTSPRATGPPSSSRRLHLPAGRQRRESVHRQADLIRRSQTISVADTAAPGPRFPAEPASRQRLVADPVGARHPPLGLGCASRRRRAPPSTVPSPP